MEQQALPSTAVAVALPHCHMQCTSPLRHLPDWSVEVTETTHTDRRSFLARLFSRLHRSLEKWSVVFLIITTETVIPTHCFCIYLSGNLPMFVQTATDYSCTSASTAHTVQSDWIGCSPNSTHPLDSGYAMIQFNLPFSERHSTQTACYSYLYPQEEGTWNPQPTELGMWPLWQLVDHRIIDLVIAKLRAAPAETGRQHT